jgi:hypothetical protein
MNLYKKMLSKGKEAIAAMELPFKVKQEEKKLELKILEVEQEMATEELKVQEVLGSYPLDIKKYLESEDAFLLTTRRLEQLHKLQKQLFKDEVQEN